MKTLTLLWSFLVGAAAVAAEPVTALEACKALPVPQQKSIARIVGRGGMPLPESWTILVFEPKVQNGLREFTVTAGTVVASRGISEYAQRLTEGDIIGLNGIKFDATQLAELAASYADANQLTPAALNYDLHKEGQEAAPLWKITALDQAGAPLGDLVVTAHTGALITKTGFANAPEFKDLAAMSAAEAEEIEETAEDKPQKQGSRSSGGSSSKKSASTSKKKPSAFRRVGGHLQKFFTGKNTIGR